MPETWALICCCRASHCACVSTRPLPAACTDPPDGNRSALVCVCAPIANVGVIATTSAVRISSSPVLLREVVRLVVNRCADGERREHLRCAGRSFDFVPHEQESNSLVSKAGGSAKGSHFFLESGLLSCRRVRVIRELMTVHNGGCHESVRSRANDVRYSSGVFSCLRSRSGYAPPRVVQCAGNEPVCAAAARRSLEVMLRQRRRVQD